jgi:hypothetical protein
MFQLPLILFIINRIKPLTPKRLFKYERHLVVFAFVTAFIMNPTPNLVDQMIVVVPIIVMYQVGIALIWFVNRGKNPSHIAQLRAADAERQAARAQRRLQPLILPDPLTPVVTVSTEGAETAIDVSAEAPEDRPRPYVTDPTGPARRSYLPLRGQLVQ